MPAANIRLGERKGGLSDVQSLNRELDSLRGYRDVLHDTMKGLVEQAAGRLPAGEFPELASSLDKVAGFLAALVEHEIGLKPFSGVVFIFRSKRANRIKLLVWDGTGLVLVSKVLQTGGFHWPRAHDGVMRLSASQASALFEGLQWSKMHTPRTQVPVTAR